MIDYNRKDVNKKWSYKWLVFYSNIMNRAIEGEDVFGTGYGSL